MKTRYLMIRFVRSRRLAAGPLASALSVLFAVTSAHAASLTWDNGVGTDNWNLVDANFGGSWINGDTAVFGGSSDSTVTINASGISANGVTFNVNNDVLAQSGGYNLALTTPCAVVVNDGLSASISAPLAGSAGFTVESNSVSGTAGSGGTLTTSGVNTVTAGSFIVGSVSSGNTWNLSGGGTIASGTGIRSLYIGNSSLSAGLATTGNNAVVFSTPGSATGPTFNLSGNGGRMTMGYASSGNSLTVNNGAYVAQTNGGGTNTWTIGALATATGNSMTISGTSSTVSFGSNQILDVGMGGSNNSLTVSNGGLLRASRLGVGDGGGSHNSATILGTGAGSSATVTLNGSTNGVFEIGSGSTATSNFVSIQAGGVINLTASGTSRNFSIGGKGQQNSQAAGGSSNYLEITGPRSAFNMTTALPLVVGGTASGAGPGTLIDGGDNNHIDISSNASMTLTNTSLYVLGSTSNGNTSINLGNGTGTSTLTLGQTANYTAGVLLNNANGRLNFNSGRLIAGVNGSLVSGAGQIVLNGPAYISTIQAASTIGSVISGVGSLSKEGSGTLTLAAGTNTYSGDTKVVGGTLELLSANPNNHAAAVTIDTSLAKLNLNFVGDNVVGSLVINGVSLPAGTYGSTSSTAPVDNQNDAAFAGTGTLTINGAAPAVTYASWAIDKGIGAALPNDDYDNDGVSNVVEMLVGGDPKSAMDAALLPKVALVSNPGSLVGDYLEFTYRRSALSVSAGVSATCQSTTDLLLPWTTATNGVNGVVVIETAGFYATGASAIDRVQVYVPRASHAMLFGRLQVTVP